MTGNKRKIYKSRTAADIVLRILFALVIVFVVGFIALYFGLKKYIVIDESGLHLEVPYLQTESSPDETPHEAAVLIED